MWFVVVVFFFVVLVWVRHGPRSSPPPRSGGRRCVGDGFQFLGRQRTSKSYGKGHGIGGQGMQGEAQSTGVAATTLWMWQTLLRKGGIFQET